MRAEQVAVAGHRGDVGQPAPAAARGVQVVDDGHLERAAGAAPAAARRGSRPRRRRTRRRRGGPARGRSSTVPAAEQQPGAAEVLGLQVLDRADRGVDVLDRHRVGGATRARAATAVS